MSATFTKLFTSITESTIWCEPSDIRVVWITMLAMADKNGRVWASVPGLANRAQVSLQAAEEALEKFQSPDPYSRTPDHEGRRIAPIDGGWMLLNHAKHRAIQDNEERKAYKREWIKKKRSEGKGVDNDVDNVDESRHQYTQADTDTDTDTDTERSKEKTLLSSPEANDASLAEKPGKIPQCPHQEIIDLYHKTLPELPKVVTWTTQRRTHLQSRWREWPHMHLWAEYFERVRKQPFLMGKTSNGRKPFRASLPWLVKPENFAKVLEGMYE